MPEEILQKIKIEINRYNEMLKKSKFWIVGDNVFFEDEFNYVEYLTNLENGNKKCYFINNENDVLLYVVRKYQNYINKNDNLYICYDGEYGSDKSCRVYINLATLEKIYFTIDECEAFETNHNIIYGSGFDCYEMAVEYFRILVENGSEKATQQMLEKYKSNKLLSQSSNKTLSGNELIEISEEDDIYDDVDLAINYYANGFGILTRYVYDQKEYVIYKIGDRSSVDYFHSSYTTFDKCLKQAQQLQKGYVSYIGEIQRISEEVEKEPLVKQLIKSLNNKIERDSKK